MFEEWKPAKPSRPVDTWSDNEVLYLTACMKLGGENWQLASYIMQLHQDSNRPFTWFTARKCRNQFLKLLKEDYLVLRSAGSKNKILSKTPLERIIHRFSKGKLKDQFQRITNEIMLDVQNFKRINEGELEVKVGHDTQRTERVLKIEEYLMKNGNEKTEDKQQRFNQHSEKQNKENATLLYLPRMPGTCFTHIPLSLLRRRISYTITFVEIPGDIENDSIEKMRDVQNLIQKFGDIDVKADHGYQGLKHIRKKSVDIFKNKKRLLGQHMEMQRKESTIFNHSPIIPALLGGEQLNSRVCSHINGQEEDIWITVAQNVKFEELEEKPEHSLLYKEDFAHIDSIQCCAWGCHKKQINCDDWDLRVIEDNVVYWSLISEEIEYNIITGSVDCAKIWTFEDNKLTLKHTLPHPWGVISVSINSDGTKCATTSVDHHVFVWDIEMAQKIKSIDLEINDLFGASFTPDDNLFVFGRFSGRVYISNVESEENEEILMIYPKEPVISCAIMSSDGKYIACGTLTGLLEVFDTLSGRQVYIKRGIGFSILSFCFSTDSKFLLSGSNMGHITIHKIKKANIVGLRFGSAARILGIAFSPDNRHFVSSSDDGTVRVWDIRSEECLHTFTEHENTVWDITYNPEGNKIMSVSGDKSINIYETVMDRCSKQNNQK
ncbi:hypothetical protein R5R35_008119 [Gryllus longicercus]|uniref:Uncharacterized protein n=1 Tax=Gryllus longicercus TaxID=2509291 RepID=A0AAN9V1E2_9ORTH